MLRGGVFFLAGFSTSDAVKDDPTGFLRFVNEGNAGAFVARFAWSPKDEGFYAEGYYGSTYEKHGFGNFLTNWLSEVANFLGAHTPQVKKYLKTDEH